MKRLRDQWHRFMECRHLPLHLRITKFISGCLDAYHLHLSESLVTNSLAIVVGILTGYGAVGFRWLIANFTGFWDYSGIPFIQKIFPYMGDFAFVPVPVVGFLLVALITWKVSEVRGEGIPEVMESVALKGGRIRGRVLLAKPLACAITIGFGGSVGREGPIVQIGSTIGSLVSTVLRMSTERRKWLVACGAGAGIAATFNAPIAGVIFAMEVILHGSSLRSFASVVLATVSGSIIGRMYFGNTPAFEVPQYAYTSHVEIIFYLLMGVVAAYIGVSFTKIKSMLEESLKKIAQNIFARAAIGGLILGIIGTLYPEIRGVGYEGISSALNSNMVWTIMLALMIAKLLATSLTIASGGSGGIFAPCLFIGSMMGGVCGHIFNAILPEHVSGPQPYALVGMAAVYAAAARAPFSSIIILFELTGNYEIILPLMASVVIATVIANHISPDSIYTEKLKRRGVRLQWGANADILESIKIKDVMVMDVDTVRENTSKKELENLFNTTHHNGFPVLDKSDRLVGIVTHNDFYAASRLPDYAPVDRFCTHTLLMAHPDDNLSKAIKMLRVRDVGRLLVVDEDDESILIGIITRSDILTAYERALKIISSDDIPLDLSAHI